MIGGIEEARRATGAAAEVVMRLLITDPTQVVADHADVTSVRAEDESGSFGVLKATLTC